MNHILILISLGSILTLFLVILYVSFVKEQRILKFSRKPGRRIWFKLLTYHPLTLPFLIMCAVSTFVGVILLREINIFNEDNARELFEVSIIVSGAYLLILFIWITGLQNKVKPMNPRKFNRTFSKVYKSNETLYDLNGLNYSSRCKITTLQIQLYSEERVTPKMALDAKYMFKPKFIVKAISPAKIKKNRKKTLKELKKNIKIQKKKLKKNSY